MKRYDSYKDSGVKWLGEIPSHWEMRKMKFSFDERSDKGYPSLPLLAATQNHGVIKKEDYENRTVEATKSLDTLKKVEKGDFVISLRSFQGGIELCYCRGIISPAYTILRPTHIKGCYFKYLGKSPIFIQLLKSMVTGIREGQNIDYAKLRDNQLPIPSLKEQEAIANYLDAATSKIDEAIAQQQKMIDLLNERKQIIINNAVTKGLDPNVKMKPSGIDWIGDIPEHWEIRKLGSIGSTINGVSHDSSYFGEGFPFVSYSDVYKNNFLPKIVTGLAKSSKLERKIFSVERGDVFFTRTSETAEEIGFTSTCLDTISNAVFAGFLIRFRPKKGLIEPSFSKYYFRAHIHRSYFVKEMNLVIRASLSQQLLKGLPILLPPLKEQKKIADYLDNKVAGIDSCISNINQQISLLQERKQIIINDVVTGKVKVV